MSLKGTSGILFFIMLMIGLILPIIEAISAQEAAAAAGG